MSTRKAVKGALRAKSKAATIATSGTPVSSGARSFPGFSPMIDVTRANRNVQRTVRVSGRAKMVAMGVAGFSVYGMAKNRTGRAVDKVRGRPTGMYGF